MQSIRLQRALKYKFRSQEKEKSYAVLSIRTYVPSFCEILRHLDGSTTLEDPQLSLMDSAEYPQALRSHLRLLWHSEERVKLPRSHHASRSRFPILLARTVGSLKTTTRSRIKFNFLKRIPSTNRSSFRILLYRCTAI